MKKKYLEVGKIVGTHGLRGELRIEPWCDSASFLCKFKVLYILNGEKKINVLSSKVHKNIVIMSLEGIDTIEKADMLRGTILYIDRNDINLQEDKYFIQDIIGLEVIDYNTNKSYGHVTDVFKTGANDVYQVSSSNNKQYLLPVIDDVVIKIDIDNEQILIRPIKGIFEDEN